jgi:phosphatidylserine/phosphatidylglycerophosphate/cardiolipin synthase-like enzyme
MKHFVLCLIVAAAGLSASCQYTPGTLPPIEIYFSPQGGCTEAIVHELAAARQSILVQAYSFTSVPIAKAIVEAHRRGVAVDVILDKSQKTENYSSADFVLHAGIPVKIDSHHAIAHNKIMIIDGQVVVTGSFNFTEAAEEHNAENMLIIRDAAIAQRYAANWELHAAHSKPYIGKEETAAHAAAGDPPRSSHHAAGPTGGNYVASRDSQVFHAADCPSAAKISPEHRIQFASRDEAIQAGKKPCHECNP